MKSTKEIMSNSKLIKTLQFKKKWLNEGFTQVSNRLLRDSNISWQARYVYMLLMSRCFQKDFSFPGQKVLGDEMGVSRVYITKLIKELENAGWVEVKRRGQGKTNIYFLKRY